MNSFYNQIRKTVVVMAVGGMALLPLTTAAQDDSPGDAEHSHVKGAKALQFAVGSNFTLRSFSGSTITYKKHTRSNVAWRVGVTAYSTFDDNQISELRDSLESGRDNDNTIMSVELELVRIKYGSVSKRTTFFWGVGPQVYYRYRKTVTDRTGPNGYRTFARTRQNWYRAGLSGVVGVEWFMNSKLSLSAEYRSELVYRWNNEKTKSTRTPGNGGDATIFESETKGDGFTLNSGGVVFGLSVYF